MLCVSSCYGHVVEHTETVGSAAHTVVSWRSVNTGKQVIDRQVIHVFQSGYKIKPKATLKKTSARGCGVMNVDHSQVLGDCVKIRQFWKMLHVGLLKLLGNEIPVSWTVMYMCNLGEDGKYKSEGQTPDKSINRSC